MGFLPSFLDEIKSRVSISEIVSKRVKLKKYGKKWRGISPFSGEKSPSFVVDDEQGIFHDPSTGRVGDIFKFLVELEKLSFDDAVEKMATEVGFKQEEISSQKISEEYTSSSDVRRWLETQSSEVCLAYSTRSSLRAIPFLLALSMSRQEMSDSIEPMALLTFRANAAAWAVSKFSARHKGLRTFAKAAHDDLLTASRHWKFESPANIAVGRALASAARAGMSGGAVVNSTVLDIEESFSRLAEANPFVGLELEGAITDVAEIGRVGGVDGLIHRPLWLPGIPRAIQNEWDELRSGLLALNKDWFIWVDWYNARLNGLAAQEAIEIKRGGVPRSVWLESPAAALTKIIEAVSGDASTSTSLLPLENIPSPFSFEVSDLGKISLVESSSNVAQLPYRSSKRDHLERLSVCHALANDILGDLTAGKFQARTQYADSIRKYVSRLPNDVGKGNFLLADAEARTLRSLFAAEVSTISIGLSAQLKTFLEQHMGLRVFYPGVENFYRDVQSGRMREPLPLDAIEGFLEGVKESTPAVFEPTVESAIQGSREFEHVSIESSTSNQLHVEAGQPLPPKDPLGEIDQSAASDFTFAGAANGIWKAFLQGEKVHKALDGWSKARETLSPHVGEILNWLHKFLSAGDGSPPLPPAS